MNLASFNHDVPRTFYCYGKEYNVKYLQVGDYVSASTLPYSAKYEDQHEVLYGWVVTKSHYSIYDVKIELPDGSIRDAVNPWMRGDTIIEKLTPFNTVNSNELLR